MSVLYLLYCSLAGIVLYNVYVIAVFRTGAVFSARERNGLLRKRVRLSGLLNSLLLLALMTGFFMTVNRVGIRSGHINGDFPGLFLFDFALYTVLFLYDTLVIDLLVLVKWRPRFLGIPVEMNAASMKKHILVSIPIGMLAGMVLCLLVSAVSGHCIK